MRSSSFNTDEDFSNALTQVILTALCRWCGTIQENRKLSYTVCIHSTTSKLTNTLRNSLQVEAFKGILYLKCVVVPICRHSALCLYFLSILLSSGCFRKSTFELWSPQPIRAWVQDFINNKAIVLFSLLCSQSFMGVQMVWLRAAWATDTQGEQRGEEQQPL